MSKFLNSPFQALLIELSLGTEIPHLPLLKKIVRRKGLHLSYRQPHGLRNALHGV